LVSSIHNSTEVAIQNMIDFSQRMINVQSKGKDTMLKGFSSIPLSEKGQSVNQLVVAIVN
jgi:hypothetical protein